MNDRDTKFSGFAKLLLDELLSGSVVTIETPFQDDWREEWQTLIAQRAYDLACHVLDNTPNYIQYKMEDIPDLTQWPESPTE